MQAIDLVKSLMADGVTFETDGERIRWKSRSGPLSDEAASTLKAAKADVLAFLTRAQKPTEIVVGCPNAGRLPRQVLPDHPGPARHIMERLEGDVDTYAEALRLHGPMSYGQAMDVLGWGATRAGQAETDLRTANRICFTKLGRAVLIDEGDDRK